jgi:hypothetical protein
MISRKRLLIQQFALWTKQAYSWPRLMSTHIAWSLARNLTYVHKYAKELIQSSN